MTLQRPTNIPCAANNCIESLCALTRRRSRGGRGIQRGNRYLCANAQRSIANQGNMTVAAA